jgi:DNA-binding MarR family transcriptional regulator
MISGAGRPPRSLAPMKTRSPSGSAPRGRPARARRLPSLLRRAWFGLNQAFRHHTAPLGLTPDQYTVLRILWEAGPGRLTQGELAGVMSSDPNTIASLLARMEKQGLVERPFHPRDRRARALALSRAGRRRFFEARRLALALQAGVLSVLPGRRRAIFLAELDQVASACWQAALRGERAGAGHGAKSDPVDPPSAHPSSAVSAVAN